jgi:transaldolase
VDLVKKTAEIFRRYGIRCELIAASIRNARQARECALAGADIATLPLVVIKDLLTHYKTQEGMRFFRNDTIPEYESLAKRES